jgi:dienelactone hydrolase
MKLMAALISMAAAAASQPPPAPLPANVTPDMMRAAAAERARLDVVADMPGTGHYPAIKQVDPSLPGHVVYRPAALERLGGRKLGVVVWGNGGCSDDGASARFHLLELASHGYLVIAPGRILSGPGAPPRGPVTTELTVRTTSDQVRAGIDWALAENARVGSIYHGRIGPGQVAVAGHSCGGLQALQVAGDPRVRTVLIHNSGVYNDATNPRNSMKVDKALLRTLHTPVVYILGGPTDIAYPNGTDDFARIDHVPAMLLNLGVGHGGTFNEPNGGRVAQVAVAWLDWRLRGDRAAGRWFTGKNCTLCRDPAWTVQRKGI